MKARWWILAGGALSVGLWLASRPAPRPTTRDVEPRPAEADDAQGRRYRLQLSVRDVARLPAASGAAVPIDAQVELRGELVVFAPSATTRRVRFEAIDAASLTIGDEGKRASMAALLEGLEAGIVLGENAAVTGVRVPLGTSLAAERLVKLVASELVWCSRTGSAGPTTAGHRLGESNVTFTWEGPDTFVRTRHSYRSWTAFDALDVRGLRAEITGGARGAIDAEGQLTSLRIDERVLARHPSEREPLLTAETRLEVDLMERAAKLRPVAARLGPVRALFDHPTSEAAQARARDARVAGLTGEALTEALDRTGATGEFADHAQMLVRATGLLRQEPGLIAELGARFASERTSDRERTLLLDLLVGAGTPEAQAEVVERLRSPVVREHPERHLWDQRLSFVTAPTPDTVRYAEQAFAQRTGIDGTTAGYVLGAMADHLAGRGQAEAASSAAGRIVERLEVTTDPSTTAHLLAALGNAGQLRWLGGSARTPRRASPSCGSQ